MAGYIIYSLDWDRFRAMIERPTPGQLAILAQGLADSRATAGDDGDLSCEFIHYREPPSKQRGMVSRPAGRVLCCARGHQMSGTRRLCWAA